MSPDPATNEIDRARQRVAVGPAPSWAVRAPVDEDWRVPGGMPATLLLRDEQHHAGEHAVFFRQVTRLETLPAILDAAQWKFDFVPATQRIVLHTLAVRRAGASVDQAVPERFRFARREAGLEAFVVDGRVSLLVLLEDLRIGDVVEMALTVISEPLVFADHFWALVFPPADIPLRTWRWSVRFAASRPLRWKCGDEDLRPVVCDLPGGHVEWQWSFENTRAEPEEPGTPAWTLPARWLQVSDFASWAEVASGLLVHWPDDFADPELLRAAGQIAAEAPTLDARVARAFALVQDEIRSPGPSIEGAIPAPLGIVLHRRFGDARDKSHLLAHLLRCLGVPARPVLVHSRLAGSLGDLLPSPAFNHAVVEYELEGKRRWVDPTIPLQGGDAHNRSIPAFGLGLPLGPGVSAIEEQPSVRKVGHVTLHERFGIDETAVQSRMVMVLRGTGAEADELRRRIQLRGPDAYGDERAQFYRQFFPGAQVVGKVEWHDNRSLNEFRVALMLSLPMTGALNPEANMSTFAYSAHLIRGCLPVPSSDRRRTPLQLAEGMKFDHIIELTNTRMPTTGDKGHSVRHRVFDFTGHSENRTHGHVVHFSLSVLRSQLRPRDLGVYLSLLDELWRATSVQLYVMRGAKNAVAMRKGGTLLPVRSALVLPPPPAGPPLPAAPAPALTPGSGEPAPDRRGLLHTESPRLPSNTGWKNPRPRPVEATPMDPSAETPLATRDTPPELRNPPRENMPAEKMTLPQKSTHAEQAAAREKNTLSVRNAPPDKDDQSEKRRSSRKKRPRETLYPWEKEEEETARPSRRRRSRRNKRDWFPLIIVLSLVAFFLFLTLLVRALSSK